MVHSRTGRDVHSERLLDNQCSSDQGPKCCNIELKSVCVCVCVIEEHVHVGVVCMGVRALA